MATKKLRNAQPAKPTVTPTVKAPTKVQKDRADRGQRTTEAPVVNDVHAPKPDCVATARKRLTKEAQKAAHEGLVAELASGRKAISALTVADLTTKDVATIAKERGWKGYSGLTAAEGRVFLLNGGDKPAPKEGTTRHLREVVAQAKKDGLVTGPVSSLKVEKLKEVFAQVEAGKKVTVEKSAPNKGTMDWHKNLLRVNGQKGFTAQATAECKKMFGAKASISTLKAEQVRALTLALGLSDGKGSR